VSAANAADTDGPELPEVIVGGVGVGGGVGGAGVAVAGAGVVEGVVAGESDVATAVVVAVGTVMALAEPFCSEYQQVLSTPTAGSPKEALLQETASLNGRTT